MRGEAYILMLAICGASAGPVLAELHPREIAPLTVPSGQPVEFYDSFLDRPTSGLTARFRFIAPELAAHLQKRGYAHVEADLAYLCETYALDRIAQPKPAIIVISMSDVVTDFGAFDPNVTQVFEGYKPQGAGEEAHCVWEAF